MNMEYTVNYFQTTRDDYPVMMFMANEDKQTVTKIIRHIDALEKLGPFLRMPYTKKLESNLFELRILGKNNIRIFYCMHLGDFYLLHAFKKKTQKTPQKELKTALERRKQMI